MAGKRFALLIGTSTYADPEFPRLAKPTQDVRDLAEVLRDPAIGGFDEVQELVNRPCYEVKPALERFFLKNAPKTICCCYIFPDMAGAKGICISFAPIPNTTRWIPPRSRRILSASRLIAAPRSVK